MVDPPPSSPLAAALSEEEQRVWESLITVVLCLPIVLDRQLRAGDGLSHFDYSVLARLATAPDRTLRLGELAHLTGSTLSRLSKAVSRYEREGWMQRLPDPASGRSTLGALTDQGFDRLVSSAPAHLAQVRELVFDALGPGELAALEVPLTRIADAVRGSLSPGAGQGQDGEGEALNPPR